MTPVLIQLRSLRTEAGLSQLELAESAGVRQATVSAIEQGSKMISLEVLDRLCAALSKALGRDVVPGDLLTRETRARRR
jgi:transcriptional regulator with XRE-family HTH domain